MRTARHSLRRRRAFTLVELMVVIVIIGILAGIVAVSVSGEDEKARVTVAKDGCKKIYDAVQRYKLRAMQLPETLDQLIDGPSDYEGRWRPLLTSRKSLKDPWGVEYVYDILSEDDERYTITSYGKDKASGGEGLSKDIVYPDEDEGGQ